MPDDRKTLEQRATMTDIDRLRHSASHVLATAILKICPEAQFAAGPPVENGFYYAVDLPHRISPADFEKIKSERRRRSKRTIRSSAWRFRAMKRSILARRDDSRRSANAPSRANSSSTSSKTFRLTKRSRSIVTASSSISAPGHMSCAPETLARLSSP